MHCGSESRLAKPLCLQAAIEITAGEKQKAADIHRDMFRKYMKWVEHLLTPGSVVTEDTPEYVTEGMMKTVDVAGKKEYKGTADGKKMWSKWHRLRKDILNRDNIVVAKAIARMPNSALPSGTDFSLFLDHVVYELYLAKEAAKNKDNEEEEKDSGGNDVADRADTDVGGSATKAAGNTSYMSPSGKTDDRDSDGHADDGHDNVQQDDEQDDGQDDEQVQGHLLEKLYNDLRGELDMVKIFLAHFRELMEEGVHCRGLNATQLFHIIKTCRSADHSQPAKNFEIRGAPFTSCSIGWGFLVPTLCPFSDLQEYLIRHPKPSHEHLLRG